MIKFLEKAEAIRLRKEGRSYSQIRANLAVSKSTLSCWLKDYPLSEEKLRSLQALNEKRIENFRKTMNRKREIRLLETYQRENKIIFPLTKRELFLSGLFLYWGEGEKTHRTQIAISNTNPQTISFAVHWLTKSLKVPKEKIKIVVHLYNDMDIEKELQFWSKLTKIPLNQFRKPYIKNTGIKSVNYKGFGHGTCNVRVGGARLTEKVQMALKAIGDHYSGM